ncbi:hypothetical protein C8T65DRAFT_64483 [Cerioporus squamosus]|nr:hypothetical protein C8T65DRAFT_64483 [Cerioporus squamosus]
MRLRRSRSTSSPSHPAMASLTDGNTVSFSAASAPLRIAPLSIQPLPSRLTCRLPLPRRLPHTLICHAAAAAMSQILFTIPVYVTPQIYGPIRLDFTWDGDVASLVKAGAWKLAAGSFDKDQPMAAGKRDKLHADVEVVLVVVSSFLFSTYTRLIWYKPDGDCAPVRRSLGLARGLKQRVRSLRALITPERFRRTRKGAWHAMDFDADATPLLPLSVSHSTRALTLSPVLGGVLSTQ